MTRSVSVIRMPLMYDWSRALGTASARRASAGRHGVRAAKRGLQLAGQVVARLLAATVRRADRSGGDFGQRLALALALLAVTLAALADGLALQVGEHRHLAANGRRSREIHRSMEPRGSDGM